LNVAKSDDLRILAGLNDNYVRSVGMSDVRWFDEHLAQDFRNTNPDGSLVGREAFLAQISKPSAVKDIRPRDVEIRLFGDFAIIHARTTYQKPDGTAGSGRYTDDWHRQGGRWRCVSAHVSRF
jgi:ketosteroid isomerase-like protein